MMNSKTLEMLQEVQSEHPGQSSFVHDLEHLFAPLALRIFSTFCTGKDLYEGRRDVEKDVCKKVSDGSWAVAVSLLLKLPNWRGVLPWSVLVDRPQDALRPEFKRIFAERRAAMAAGEQPKEDCVSQMILDDLSEKDIFDHMFTLLCAGHDTTAFFSCYLCYQLAQCPDIQQKLREEIVSVMKDREIATADDIKEMVYMRKVMFETLRYYAIIPNLSRCSETDYEIKELKITIPKGMELIVPMCVINRDEAVWEKPYDFNPERFEGTEITVARKGFFPFGYGSRICIGNTLAQMESSVFMIHILRKFALEVDPTFKLRITSGISLTTLGGIRVRLRKLETVGS